MEEDSSSEDENDRPMRPPSRQPISKMPRPPPPPHISKDGSAVQPMPMPPSLDKVLVKKGYDPKIGKFRF